jgi:PelA/Pel-15E family pectate lyase
MLRLTLSRYSNVLCHRFSTKRTAIAFLFALIAPTLHAAVIGTSQPAQSITPARIAALPFAQRQPWLDYLDRSERQMLADRAALAAERKSLATIPPLPKESGNAHTIPLNHDPAWYATPEARRIGDIVLSFQTPAGGWSKNLDMAAAPRLPGQSYTTDNLSKHLGPGDFDTPRDPNWNYVGTLDNDATTTQLRFLALLSKANPGPAGNPYRASFLRGIDYLLAAQFPNGGWPQVWPLEGGYHDAITFNDDAVSKAAAILSDIAAAKPGYTFVPATLRARANAAFARALDCILATQIKIDGHPTVWAQQHDALTLAPVAGRNFEPAALSSGESASLLIFLMSLPHPSPAVLASIQSGIAWLKSAAVYDDEWSSSKAVEGGRHLSAKSGAGPIWARYYSLATGKPIFGDRDKTIHDDVNELSLERRNGYAWYSPTPQQAIDAYVAWATLHLGRSTDRMASK